MKENNEFVVSEYTIDSNNMTGYANGNACEYSNQGHCDCCCEPTPQ